MAANICRAVAKLLWTEVFKESPNNSNNSSKYVFFCRQRNAFITSEIPMTLVDIHDVAFVSLRFRKDIQVDSVNTASPLLY